MKSPGVATDGVFKSFLANLGIKGFYMYKERYIAFEASYQYMIDYLIFQHFHTFSGSPTEALWTMTQTIYDIVQRF